MIEAHDEDCVQEQKLDVLGSTEHDGDDKKF